MSILGVMWPEVTNRPHDGLNHPRWRPRNEAISEPICSPALHPQRVPIFFHSAKRFSSQKSALQRHIPKRQPNFSVGKKPLARLPTETACYTLRRHGCHSLSISSNADDSGVARMKPRTRLSGLESPWISLINLEYQRSQELCARAIGQNPLSLLRKPKAPNHRNVMLKKATSASCPWYASTLATRTCRFGLELSPTSITPVSFSPLGLRSS